MSDIPQTLTISHVSNYQFLIDFGMEPKLQTDEPAPIGQNLGPSPEQLLAAGVVNCLCASLFFALTKYRQVADGIKAHTNIFTCRNERGRLRIERIDVALELGAHRFDEELLNRALSQFEDFCTVSESVKLGIPVAVSIADQDGKKVLAPELRGQSAARSGAASPEELVRLFAERANAGDVEGLVDLYEPDATLAAGERLSHGQNSIREFYGSLLERKNEFSGASVVEKVTSGDIAVTVAQAPNGALSLEVARRQSDGGWRWVIDQLKLKVPSG